MICRRVSLVAVSIALLALALGCNSDKAQNAALNHPKIRISMDANNSIPSCYASIGWASMPVTGTIDWTASSKDTNTYQVTFPYTPYPVVDSAGNLVSTPIVVNSSGTQSGSNKGPFTLSPQANYSCKATADAAQCYFSYDIKMNGQTCIQRYGSGAGVYSTGVHLER